MATSRIGSKTCRSSRSKSSSSSSSAKSADITNQISRGLPLNHSFI
ncbi:hypothetical protein M5D96_011700, partial [Drosophila gunungcola]